MRRLLCALPLLAALLLACAQEEDVVTRDIVSDIPWPDQERAEYVLLDAGSSDELGTGVLSVARQDGQYELTLRFEGDGNVDEAVVLVDAVTLKPASVSREITAQGLTTSGEYRLEEDVVDVTETGEDGDERTVPLRLEEHSYDNESSLFLWRTLPFQEGFEAAYHSVLVNRRGNATAKLLVVGKEQITVPAGTFDAWRVEIDALGSHPVAWYADTPERPLIQFQNDDLDPPILLQLTSLE